MAVLTPRGRAKWPFSVQNLSIYDLYLQGSVRGVRDPPELPEYGPISRVLGPKWPLFGPKVTFSQPPHKPVN